MQVKKAGGKIFGAVLTSDEKRAMDIEIKRQLAEYNKKNEIEIDALVLWTLHKQFGFGHKRLKQFYDSFGEAVSKLVEHYELTDSDMVWICTQELKDYGIDLEQWQKERR